MSTRTGIEWTNATWNPMTGCTKISLGCDNCYAFTLAHTKVRDAYLRRPPVRDTEANRNDPFAPRFWENRLMEPLSWREPKRVFVNSMSDVFHAHFSLGQIQKVFAVMNACAQHQFQLLTKRPERALRYALSGDIVFTDNIWMGASVETMDVAHRVDTLRRIDAHVRFLSCEPLLGPLDSLDLSGIHWVIGGGESGIGHRPCLEKWAIGLRDNCVRNDVAFFWKQWGGRTPKAGGRMLAGDEWNEYPQPLPEASLAV